MPQRRNLGGARREASDRVVMVPKDSHGEKEILAWTLNVSRGGVRVVLEDPVHVGFSYLASVGEGPARPATVVWIREESDGQIAGLRFDDVEGGEVPGSTYPPGE